MSLVNEAFLSIEDLKGFKIYLKPCSLANNFKIKQNRFVLRTVMKFRVSLRYFFISKFLSCECTDWGEIPKEDDFFFSIVVDKQY